MQNGRRRMELASDPSFDSVLALILRYTRPVTLSGMAFTRAAVGVAQGEATELILMSDSLTAVRTTQMKLVIHCWLLALSLTSCVAYAKTIGCTTTTWKLVGANHKVCVEAFHDPKVPGVTCHVSQARTGGISGTFGLAQDPSQFSLACRQTGPITLPAKLPEEETVFSEDTSILFKETRILRMWDAANRTLVYLAISRKLIEGAPANSISTVPVMPWGGKP